MRTWIFASVCVLFVSLVSHYVNKEDWTSYQYLVTTGIMAIWLKINEIK